MLKHEGSKIFGVFTFDADTDGLAPLSDVVVPPASIFVTEGKDVEIADEGLVIGRLFVRASLGLPYSSHR